MFMRHRFSIACLCLFLLTAGLGCKGLSKEEKAAIRPIKLQYWTVYNDVPTLRAFAAEYKKMRPYVTVEIRQLRSSEFDDSFLNALADDKAPDIISVHSREIRRYQERLAPLPSAVKVSTITIKGKYNPETIVNTFTQAMPTQAQIKRDWLSVVPGDVIIDNNVWGLPLAIDTLALYYNKDILDAAGVAEPPKTWDEFVSAVKKTTAYGADGAIVQSGVGMGGAANVSNGFDVLSLLMMQNNITLADGRAVRFADGMDRPRENSPVFESLRFYTNFAQEESDVYTWNDKMENSFEAFVRGKTAFYFGFAFEYPRIRARAPHMVLETVSVPQLSPDAKDAVNIANYWVEGVVKKSKHQDEAWDFIRFITLPDQVAAYTKATHQPSPLRSQVGKQKEDPEMTAFTTYILTAKNWYRGKNIDGAVSAFSDMIRSFRVPYIEGAKEGPVERDANIIIRTAKIIQQTM
jgi:multiple sugar transport system substrate-binding protein